MTISSVRQSWYSRFISFCLVVTFITSMVITPRAASAGVMGLPAAGTMVNLSAAYVPLMITGLRVHPENPLLMDFIVNTGNDLRAINDRPYVKEESNRLIKYFFACLTIPENNQWVNLSPYEKQRIIPEDLGQTILGQDMLAQDYILKQLTASLIYPEKNLGKSFWDKVYTKARQEYGTTQIPVNTFNKVWILPEYAKVYEHQNTVLVVKTHLKVMLDEDYLALSHHVIPAQAAAKAGQAGLHNKISAIIRQIILPAIEEEVNKGQNFAQMRQIYNSMLLALWFKTNLKQALLNQVYTDKSKTNGVNVADPSIKEKIYQQYLQAYKKGVFNYIKEEPGPATIARKYFSGGLTPWGQAMVLKIPAAETERSLAGKPGDTLIEPVLTASASNNLNAAMVGIERLTVQQIMDRFNLPYPDALYFSVLIAKYLSDRIVPILGKNAIASALLDGEARHKFFGVVDGKALMDDPVNAKASKNVHVRVLELKGGLGEAFKRLATLLRVTGRKTLADKGTDSYFENVPVQGFDASGKPKLFHININVAELMVLYYIHLIKQKEYGSLEVRELVNFASKKAVEEFWNTIYLADRVDGRIPQEQKRTYRQVFSDDPQKGIKGLYFNPDFILQGVMPVVDHSTGEYLDHEALRSPAGHAAFITHTMEHNTRNDRNFSIPRITVFRNGDGVNNMLPPPVAGWMVRQNVPIVMVTTTKQLLDLKGGLITLLSNTVLPSGIQKKLKRFETLSMEDIADLQSTLYPYLLEIAQAKAVDQKDVFQKIGITLGEQSAQFFNTNMHAQYHNVLDPFLAELRQIIGDEKFYEMTGPDLIVNPKEKKLNEKSVSVIQLEGASGSALLAMNRFVLTTTDPKIIALKAKYGIERLVYFVNFDEKLRSEVFTPEKFTWDHYLYACTDLFSVNPNIGRLIFTPIRGRSTLPGFDLSAPYEDLEYDINAFGRNLGVRALDYLAIKGEVRLPNAILKGGVFIINKSGQAIDLTAKTGIFPFKKGRLVLSNIFIEIGQDGALSKSPINDVLGAIEKFEKADKAMQSDASLQNGKDVLINNQTAEEQVVINPFASREERLEKASLISNPITNAEVVGKLIDGTNVRTGIGTGVEMPDDIGRQKTSFEILYDLLIRNLIDRDTLVKAMGPQGGFRWINLESTPFDPQNDARYEGKIRVIEVDGNGSKVIKKEARYRRRMAEFVLEEIKKQISANPAMAAGQEAVAVTPGGIDLNSGHLKMEISGEKVNITFDPAMIAQFKRGDFSGVTFEILDIIPVSLMPLLGLKEE